MTDAKNLLALGCACRRAAGAFAILASSLANEVERGEQPDTGAPAEMAQQALDLERAAQHLQAQAQDSELLALLPHRERFADLLRMAQAMDRGLVFVPVEPVAADQSERPVDVVVVGQDNTASLRERMGRGLARLRRRA
ncbi:hypothetical protein [Methylobacterium oryzae]|uniref:hypothetical protein n=1 Tax=Methylobacterium oryzae TaxID=334852 RepID=UPI001F1BC7F9|nr:hypothetical protein [Methylobacterium oryzae]UIN33996.1 hypothetical protein LXM90_23400 [Methylobacterium oryzae]